MGSRDYAPESDGAAGRGDADDTKKVGSDIGTIRTDDRVRPTNGCTAETDGSEKERDPMRNILISAFTAAAVLVVAGTASAQQIQVNFGPNPGYVPPVAE